MNTFKALADPTRRHIVHLLAQQSRSSGEIASEFGISAPAVSQHLKILQAAHLVQVKVAAQRRIYTLDHAGMEELESWMAEIRQFWGGRLDRLGQCLADEAEQATDNNRGGQHE